MPSMIVYYISWAEQVYTSGELGRSVQLGQYSNRTHPKSVNLQPYEYVDDRSDGVYLANGKRETENT